MIIIAVVRSNAYVICYMSRTTSVSGATIPACSMFRKKNSWKWLHRIWIHIFFREINFTKFLCNIVDFEFDYTLWSEFKFFFRNRFFKSFFLGMVNHEENMPLLFTNSHFYDRFFRIPEVRNIKEWCLLFLCFLHNTVFKYI